MAGMGLLTGGEVPVRPGCTQEREIRECRRRRRSQQKKQNGSERKSKMFFRTGKWGRQIKNQAESREGGVSTLKKESTQCPITGRQSDRSDNEGTSKETLKGSSSNVSATRWLVTLETKKIGILKQKRVRVSGGEHSWGKKVP